MGIMEAEVMMAPGGLEVSRREERRVLSSMEVRPWKPRYQTGQGNIVHGKVKHKIANDHNC